MEHRIIESDVLIIVGGTAGCYAAIRLGESAGLRIAIAEKANIKRSGCLAAGVNALNAYITEGHTPKDYVWYASQDAEGIVREDLLYDISLRLNQVTRDMEKRGLTILKDDQGKYVTRGWRNLKINGENLKPILAGEVRKQKNVSVYEHINITDYRYIEDRVCGAYGFGIVDGTFYEFRAKAVLIATGGASGIYRPNNPDNNPHQMWYSPFNTGAGYAMGILAGAEMTTFEMRFIALRCKDTIAPTGTIAQGLGAKQVNAHGEVYEERYGLTTPRRLWGTVSENLKGRGPCYLKTSGISSEQEKDLYKAYLNMAPLQTLKWIDTERNPSAYDVEIEGTEPYIVGGHAASGYWIGRDRMTSLRGLFAAGDVAGGSPQKYVTGALAEGDIAAEGIIKYLETNEKLMGDNEELTVCTGEKKKEYEDHLLQDSENAVRESPAQLERSMQKLMDEYAGGIKTFYRYNDAGLREAERGIDDLMVKLPSIRVSGMDELLELYEVRERLIVSKTLIHHLRARKETRWHSFQENLDHPEKDDLYNCYIKSIAENEGIRIIKRDLVRME